MKFIIDRFEGKYAICELYTNDPYEGYVRDIELSRIPAEAREGDILIVEHDIITIDEEETARREVEMKKLTDDLWCI